MGNPFEEEKENIVLKLPRINLVNINNLPVELKTKIEKISVKNSEDLEVIFKKIFNKPLTREMISDLEDIFNIPEKGLIGEIVIFSPEETASGDKQELEKNTMKIICVLKDEANNYGGFVDISFIKFGEESPYMEIDKRYLKEQGSGVGLDLQCRLEYFCRKNDIKEIYNIASTEGENIGAYVWARYGYEFANESYRDVLQEDIKDYIKDKKIINLSKNIDDLEQPIDFALLTGKNEKGVRVPIGKQYLLDKTPDLQNNWVGVRILESDNKGTINFVEYLKQRGRKDLIDKYYQDV